jgi:SAM-dependent methyltransferase
MSERPWYVTRFDADYLDVYAHRDTREAERATQALLEPLGLAGRRVLDLGCGAGRYSVALQARGARVVGLDRSAPLLAAAAAAGVVLRVQADMRWLPFTAAAFDAVVSMFTSFGYFATAGEDQRVLAEVARVLRPGGDFVLDTFNTALVRRSLVAVSEREAGGWTIVEHRRIESGCIVKHITLVRGGERREAEERVRLWDDAALDAALAGAGLAVVTVAGDYDGGAFDSETSPRRIVRARRGA